MKIAGFLGLSLLLIGGVLGVERVRYHVRTERTHVSAPQIVARPLELMREPLHEGQRVVFEACSVEPDAFGPAFTDKLAFEIIVLPENEPVLRVVTDAERLGRARRGARGVCINIGDASALGASGIFAIRVAPIGQLPHAVSHMPVVGRIVAVTPVSETDFRPVLICLLGVLLTLIGFTRRATGTEHPHIAGANAYALVIGANVLVVLAVFAGGLMPPWGAIATLLNATLIIAVELACVVAIPLQLGIPVVEVVALHRVRALWFLVIPVVGVALHRLGSLLAQNVPSTGTAPIETFVAQTSGFVTVALVSVLAPVVEELFFRGVVYGTLARAKNENAAALISFVVFVLVHVPQAYGAWGSLASIALTGAVLVALRRISGSVVVPACVHLVHNATITIGAFVAAFVAARG